MKILYSVFILIFAVVVYGQNRSSLLANPKIYGMTLLGWGVDLREGVPEESFKAPLYLFDFA